MSTRGTRKSASSALPDSPQSPGISKRNASKRHIDAPEQTSPIRKSRRLNSGEELTALPPGQTQVHGNGAAKHSPDIAPSSLKTEVEEESKLSINIKRKKKGAKQGLEETTTATEKTSRKRKTKEEKESEAMPLKARTPGLSMFLGAHVSAAKGVFNAVNNSTHIGGNAFALFLKSQRKWDNPPLQNDHRDQFRQSCLEHKYDATKHILPHGSYLVNLAQEDKAKAKQAYNSFLDDLRRCEALGINLYNFHPGSANQTSFSSAISRLAKALTNALAATSTVTPVLETMCGQGTTIGGSLTEFRDILALIPQEYHTRIGVCVDTCHSHAAGYDLVTRTGFQAFLQEFEAVIGLKHLRALHINDSRTPRGSNRDLHANIGTGFLGLRAFHNVMNEPRLQDLPMILETPIDKPVSKPATTATPTNDEDRCASEDEENSASEDDNKSKKTKKQPKRPAKPKTPTIADPAIWAQEIALLESLIGMDPEGEEFRSLEKQLADEGREMREKHLEQYERRLEAEEKKKNKIKSTGVGAGAGTGKKGQRSLADMMKGNESNSAGSRTKSRKKNDEDEEGDGE